jgi:integrase
MQSSTKRKDRRQDVNPLTREEAKKFLDAARVHYPRHYPLFLCALRTGTRMGELIGLKWGDIEFNGQFIEVRQSIVRSRVTSPKNHKTRRDPAHGGYLRAPRARLEPIRGR